MGITPGSCQRQGVYITSHHFPRTRPLRRDSHHPGAATEIQGARALGPLMQGLAKPANDLSRGCSAGDIVQTSYLSLLQAKG